jgi:hypothetical protein
VVGWKPTTAVILLPEASFTKKPMTIEDIADLVVTEAPKKRGEYKKQKAVN